MLCVDLFLYSLGWQTVRMEVPGALLHLRGTPGVGPCEAWSSKTPITTDCHCAPARGQRCTTCFKSTRSFQLCGRPRERSIFISILYLSGWGPEAKVIPLVTSELDTELP